MPSDFYCQEILTGKIPVKKVMETENVLAFYHTKPSYKIHIVIIPKHHVESLIDFLNKSDRELLSEMMNVLKQVIEKVTEEHGGCRLTTNFGKFQATKHLHWHVYVGEVMMN